LKQVKEKLSSLLIFLAANISCSLFQVVVLICLAVSQFFIWFILGALGVGSFMKDQFTVDIITYAITAAIYGVVWLGFWSFLYKNGIKWFYYRIFFSIIPLVAALIMFNPAPNPMAMLPRPPEPTFSSLVTGIILLPIYSVLIYKFVLQSSVKKVRNYIFVCLSTLFAGIIIFFASLSLMHIFYKF
jgi:hypothetical protein